MPQARKRNNGTGSVYPMNAAGTRWAAAVSLGGAERVVRTVSDPDPREAERKAHLLLAELLVAQRRHRLAPPSDVTLREWAERWLERVEPGLRPSTRFAYRRRLGLVGGVLGNTRLDRLTPAMLDGAFARLRRQGRGTRVVQLAHGTLGTCLETAVDLGLLPANPLARVPRPRHEPTMRRYWSVEETRHFMAAGLATSRKWGPLFVLLAATGLRLSEALGLRWVDVDLAGHRLHIRESVVQVGGEWHRLPAKTKAGRRVVTLPQPARTALALLPPPLDPQAPVFLSAAGRPLHPSQLLRSLWALCDEAGVPRLHIHGLRHVHAMLALEASGDPYAVQRRLGHANVNVTLGIYGYSVRDEATVADGLDRLLSAG